MKLPDMSKALAYVDRVILNDFILGMCCGVALANIVWAAAIQ